MTDECFTITCSPVTPNDAGVKTTTVRLGGEFDLTATDDLRSVIAAVIDAGSSSRIIIDLADVTFIDCTTVRVLFDADIGARRNGGDYRLANAHGVVHRILDVLGMIDLLHPRPAG